MKFEESVLISFIIWRGEPEKKINAKMLVNEFQRICSLPLKFYDMKNVKAVY
jgi:hypothetical protein